MRKIILFILIPFMLIGQKKKHNITWQSNFLFESNDLNKGFLNSILYDGHITEYMKSNWAKSNNKDKVINSEIINRISYTYYFKKESLEFSISDVNILNICITDDLLALALYGNFNYQDEYLEFGGTSIRADRFQQYKITYSKKNKNININGGLSYLAGNHHLSYIIEHGSLYTAPLGTHLDVQYSMNAFITDTSNFSLFRNNGNGVAVDLGADFNIKKINIQLAIKNLGFILWNNSSISLATDSTFYFQGIEIDNIFNFNDSILESNNLTNDIIKTKNKSFKSYMPATIHLSISKEIDHKYIKNYSLGIIRKWQPHIDNKPLSFDKITQGLKESNFSPLYYIQSMFKTKYCDIDPSLSYGGYSNDINLSLALSKEWKYKFLLGTHHLESVFIGENAKAASLYFSITKCF